jgi:hypothetical protein
MKKEAGQEDAMAVELQHWDHWDVVSEIAHTPNARRLETLADLVTPKAEPAVTSALLWRLGDSIVQDDPDVEDAVCSALVRLSVMDQLGNQRFGFRPRHELPDDVVAQLRDNDAVIPLRYFMP